MLCEYFRQFGAIERVQIMQERYNAFLLDILPAIGASGFIDQPPNQRNYYAYVTFVNTLSASEALKSPRHVVQDQEITVERAFSWNQPAVEVEKYLSENQQPTSTKIENLYTSMHDALNDDCILKIMSYLDIFELAKMAKFSPRYLALAQQIRTLRIVSEPLAKPVTLMELRNILRLLSFGHSVTNLTISLKSFNQTEQRYICDRLYQYIGPQLRSLTLMLFAVTSDQFDLLKPLLFQLNYLDIDLNYNFDYRRFNCAFPNLKTLRIRTSGFIDKFISEDDAIPEFPALTKLMIASGYRLHENLFQRLHRACSQITELVVINIDDYYTELAPMVLRTTDLERLSDFKELVKLHLSFSRSYFTERILDVISSMVKLEHLTLEITNIRQADDRLFVELNANLKKIGTGLPEIKEIRLSGIALEEDKLVELIKWAPKLKSLCIHECSLQLTPQLIEKIVTKRRALFQTTMGNRTPTPLTLIVDEFSDSVVANVSYIHFD